MIGQLSLLVDTQITMSDYELTCTAITPDNNTSNLSVYL